MFFFKTAIITKPDKSHVKWKFSFYHEKGYKNWELMYQSRIYDTIIQKQKCLIDEAISFNSSKLKKTSTFVYSSFLKLPS